MTLNEVPPPSEHSARSEVAARLGNEFFNWDGFVENFGREMHVAGDQQRT